MYTALYGLNRWFSFHIQYIYIYRSDLYMKYHFISIKSDRIVFCVVNSLQDNLPLKYKIGFIVLTYIARDITYMMIAAAL